MPPESAQQTRASVPGPRMPGKLSASSVGAKKSARRRNRAAVSASEWRRRVQLRTSRACRAGRAHTPGVGAAHVYQSSSSGQNTATCAPSARSPSTATCTAGPALGTVQHKCTWAAATSTAPPRRCMHSPSQQFQCEKAGRQAAEGTACSVTLRAAGCIAVPARPSAWHAGWRQTAHVYMPVGRLGAHLPAAAAAAARTARQRREAAPAAVAHASQRPQRGSAAFARVARSAACAATAAAGAPPSASRWCAAASCMQLKPCDAV